MPAESSSTKIPTAHQVHKGELSHRLSVQSTLNGLGSLAQGTEQRPKHIGLRPHPLPPSHAVYAPTDRDSTRVLLMPSGRVGVIFSRDADGNRPTQKLVSSLAIADTMVREHKARKVIVTFVAWLANLMPRVGGSSPRIDVGRSGIRSKPGARKAGAR